MANTFYFLAIQHLASSMAQYLEDNKLPYGVYDAGGFNMVRKSKSFKGSIISEFDKAKFRTDIVKRVCNEISSLHERNFNLNPRLKEMLKSPKI